MQLYFARHAQSQNNALEGHDDYLTIRYEDPGITDLGWEQAGALASLLAGDRVAEQSRVSFRNPWNHLGFELSHIYCSLQRRSVETARVVADRVGLQVTAWPPIHEMGGVIRYDPEQEAFVGQPGADHETVQSWNPNIVLHEEVDADGWWQSREMERHEQVETRAAEVFRTLLDWHADSDDKVLIVSHGTFYNYLMCQVLNLKLRDELWFPIHNCGLTRVDIADGEDYALGAQEAGDRLTGRPIRIAYLNRLDHIPAHLIS